MITLAAPPDAKLLYRRLDARLSKIVPRGSAARALATLTEECLDVLREALPVVTAAAYAERPDGFVLQHASGGDTSWAESIPAALEFVAPIAEHQVFIFPDPRAAGSPQALGLVPRSPLGALILGRRPRRSLMFVVAGAGFDHEALDVALNTLRAALEPRLAEERIRGRFREAAEIQRSLLPEEPPALPGFEIACSSLAAEEVGGDFYDFIPMGAGLGVAVGDASGHGLPAALLVRDVVTGLRMGLDKDLKASAVLARLNRVIHRSRLSSRFVSLFYAEIEPEGDLVYVNAGHPPPLLLHASGRAESLDVGGLILGPLPDVTFRRGHARLDPGDVLVCCTDGILERDDASGEFLGAEGLEAAVRDAGGCDAREMVRRLMDHTFRFGAERPWVDDATLVVVRRPQA